MSSPPKSPTRLSRFIEADLSTEESGPSSLLSYILSEQDQNEYRRRSASHSSGSSSGQYSPQTTTRRFFTGSSSSLLQSPANTTSSPYSSQVYHTSQDQHMMSAHDVYHHTAPSTSDNKPQSTGEKIKGRFRALTLGKSDNKARSAGADSDRLRHG